MSPPPARFCLVKLNANTQKADGLISAQISGVLCGMLSLHLSGQRPGFTPLPAARSGCGGCGCGGCGCGGGPVVEERGDPTWRANKDGEDQMLLPSTGASAAPGRGPHLLGSIWDRTDYDGHEADSAFRGWDPVQRSKHAIYRRLGVFGATCFTFLQRYSS